MFKNKIRDDKVAAIQGDSRGNFTILGDDIIGRCDQNSSYEHVSDSEWGYPDTALTFANDQLDAQIFLLHLLQSCTVWCAGLDECHPNLHTKGHLYTVTYTRCRIDTINSPDDGHMAARNMYRIEINIHEKESCVKLVIYKDYTEMQPVPVAVRSKA